MLAFASMRFGQRGLTLLLAWGVLSAPAAAFAATRPSLAEAIELFKHLEDQRAAKMLTQFLTDQHSTSDAALAHVYLGLIRLNALDDRGCQEEFNTALTLDPALELPPKTSPKARPIFAEAQKAHPAPAPKPQLDVAPPPLVMVEDSKIAKAAPSRIPAYATGIGAVVVAGVGIVLGVLSNSDYTSAVAATDLGQSNSFASRSGTEGLSADVCFTVAGVTAAAAVVLYLLERGGGSAPAPVTATPGGVGVSF
jgi:hypothetical protein